MRVHQLAKEINISTKELLKVLYGIGITVKSGSSILGEQEVENVKIYLQSSSKTVYLTIKLKNNIIKKIPIENRIKTLTDNITNNKFEPKPYYLRGIIYAYIGKATEAFHDYNQSLKLDPMYAKAYYARAGLYIASNNKKLAIRDIEKAIELESLTAKKENLNPPILKGKQIHKLINSQENFENYILKLVKAHIKSGDDPLAVLNLIGMDIDNYDIDYIINDDPENIMSIIVKIVNEKFCYDKLVNFINVSEGQNDFNLWNLFYKFIVKEGWLDK